MTVRQPVPTVGNTQASRVSPEVRSSDAESLIATQLLTPSKTRAAPKRPWLVQVAPATSPVLPRPLLSATVAPFASSNAYAATSPPGGGGGGGGSGFRANAAATTVSAASASVHEAVPLQAPPLHPLKLEPESAEAVKVICEIGRASCREGVEIAEDGESCSENTAQL